MPNFIHDDKIIRDAVKRLGELFDDDMHGFRSEVWIVIAGVIKQARNTETNQKEQENT